MKPGDVVLVSDAPKGGGCYGYPAGRYGVVTRVDPDGVGVRFRNTGAPPAVSHWLRPDELTVVGREPKEVRRAERV